MPRILVNYPEGRVDLTGHVGFIEKKFVFPSMLQGIYDVLISIREMVRVIIYNFVKIVPRKEGAWVLSSHGGNDFTGNAKYQSITSKTSRSPPVGAESMSAVAD